MDKPLQLPPGSVKIDFAPALYAGKAEIAATTTALSHGLGPPRTPPRHQLPLTKVNSSLPLWPPVLCPSAFARKRPMSLPSPPPAKKLQVQQSSPFLPRPCPNLEVSPVAKPTKLQVRRATEHVSPMLKQGLPKMEILALLPMRAASIDMMQISQKPSSEILSETKDVTLTRKTNCSCKYSKCLKLYCECFAKGGYCIGCNCTNCCNNVSHENVRQDAINVALERNPAAFMPKVWDSTAHNCEDKAAEGLLVDKHTKGCNCKKSECLKKYCECFKSSVFCSENCKCTGCKNYESNEDRKAIHPITQQHTVHARDVQNPASSGMIGQSVALSCSLTSVPREDTKCPVKCLPHEVTCRKILADIIQIEDVNELCNLLILVSRQAGPAFLDSEIKENTKRKKLNRAESCLSSTNHDREAIQKEPDKQICSLEKSLNEVLVAEGRLELPRADPFDIQKGNKRPLSPGTQAMMCDEQDAVFQESKACKFLSTTEENLLDIFKEQEKRVLTNFRDYLCKLANCGRLQEQKLSSVSTNCSEQTSADNSNNSSIITRIVEVARIRETIPRFSSKYQSPGSLILARRKMGNVGI
ncbi:hypothetical protein E2562_025484 [Oryza meyeriana var. granulata]|uniref:CRC domain-containing protein n=1 Tax=Oryza meyeriana var. granulata TaxID=110450 RepID=A0A6G1CHE3_9ORYZ|nr:hypothetical protein E2562_025484 [Oryza meyeriana var. granulata]KAF0899921.1 hypothetical protein E2562_025484 [Oryza meyeriana var. granulata]